MGRREKRRKIDAKGGKEEKGRGMEGMVHVERRGNCVRSYFYLFFFSIMGD